MPKLILISCILSGVIVIGCGKKEPANAKAITEGKVVYEGSGVSIVPGTTIELCFNEGNFLIRTSMGPGRISTMKHDKRTKEALTLVQDWFGDERDLYFYYELQTDDYSGGLFAFDPDLESSTGFFGDKMLLGYECKHARDPGRSLTSTDVWYTDQIHPGIWPAAKQLTDNRLPLLYRQSYVGQAHQYEAISVSDEEIPDIEFAHVVPDSFYFKTPAEYFSTSEEFRSQFKERAIPSLKYPHFNGGRMSTIAYFEEKLNELTAGRSVGLEVKFIVDKEGKLSNIVAESGQWGEDDQLKQILEVRVKEVFEKAGRWVPASVRGANVNSKVSFIYSPVPGEKSR